VKTFPAGDAHRQRLIEEQGLHDEQRIGLLVARSIICTVIICTVIICTVIICTVII
jgi:hypothetical protein